MDGGIEALRQGRFALAGDRFALVSRQAPMDAEGPFFEAFLLWWRLLDRTSPEEARPLRLAMEERLIETVRRAGARVEPAGTPEHQRAQTYLGTALLLDAQSKAARGAHLAAASSARQGHHALSGVLKAHPGSAEALFAMGVYNYYADNIPAFAKGLRFFLMIPGGDEALGLSQLENAAQHSRLFGTESLLVLAHIHSGNYEDNFTRALGYLNSAAERHRDSPLIALVRADLLFRLGRLKEASTTAAAALVMVRSSSGFTEDLEGLALHRISACTLELQDPLTATAQVEEIVKRSPEGTTLTRRKLAALLVTAARESGVPDRALSSLERMTLPAGEKESLRRRLRATRLDPVALPRATALQSFARGQTDAATREIEALLAANPSDLRLHYDLGRMLQMQNRLDEARTHLERAAGGGTQSRLADISGWALLRLGWASESAGRRDKALAYYRRAAQLKHFTFQPAALDLLNHSALSPPEG